MNYVFQALIHVSTAYCNCDRTDVQEVIYAPPYNPDDIIALINWLPEEMLDQVFNVIPLINNFDKFRLIDFVFDFS